MAIYGPAPGLKGRTFGLSRRSFISACAVHRCGVEARGKRAGCQRPFRDTFIKDPQGQAETRLEEEKKS